MLRPYEMVESNEKLSIDLAYAFDFMFLHTSQIFGSLDHDICRHTRACTHAKILKPQPTTFCEPNSQLSHANFFFSTSLKAITTRSHHHHPKPKAFATWRKHLSIHGKERAKITLRKVVSYTVYSINLVSERILICMTSSCQFFASK